MIIASVCIDNPSKEIDRLFDYSVPDSLKESIKIGMRVIVPFGASNKLIQGVVLEINEKSEEEIKYKEIYDIIDEEFILPQDLIKLAYFMKKKYVCTLSEAIYSILPPKMGISECIEAKIITEDCSICSKKEKQFLSMLNKDKYLKIDLKSINIKRADLISMRNRGIIDLKIETKQNLNKKTVQLVRLKDNKKAIELLNNKKLKQQRNIIEYFLNNNINEILLSQLIDILGCSRVTIKSLEEKGVIEIFEREVYREVATEYANYPKHILSHIQRKAFESILNEYREGRRVSLIRGVTGCGKTEIYLNLVEYFINLNYGAIVLVPEISLTPQTVERFKGRFKDKVAILHSRLSDGERYDEWRRISRGEAKIVVGARSAVFAPVENLKLIIIDEEHEYSYKSEQNPKYLTREVAEQRVNLIDGLLVLGSATPSIESYYNVSRGIYNLIEIDERVSGSTLPDVHIVDMRQELITGNRSIFSRELYSSIEENLKNNKQTILFLNRRGYSTFVSCRECGYVCKCSNCDVAMTYHISTNTLECHYCGQTMHIPKLCPKCKSKYIKHFGAGTEKIEQEVKRLFPSARVIRMDMDTTRKKGEHERLYRLFKEHKADILIGTQMISKGMDFKNVTLVGVVAADTMLNLPDFRAAERTFQLLVQVAGRAGRGYDKGKVVIQTYEPEHYSIQLAATQNYNEFYKKEIEIRRFLNNPPFTDLTYFLFTSNNEEELIKICKEIEQEVKRVIPSDFTILGPTPNFISKIKNTFRWNMMIKGCIVDYIDIIDKIIYDKTRATSVKYSIDLNPYSLI
ncbi:primosomal protein N' [Caloramator proteoclasticus]|uniref:Replication restart protein PriA n=1 Tax=Caloramator proteoclasticus DSM 10124 TaxID=1121262 RepID=A0A1M5AN74_9CLOT|nr:primosomal protein N' [Caloramator proteoclasticus]SHF31721.1 replication restart DNA helicase PriA [Caloramator proteoclasticus DSM 10124]